jgi:twitching motility protein PilT
LRSAPTPAYDARHLRALLSEAVEAGATDLHFKVPGPPRFRIGGALRPTQRSGLSPSDTHRLAQTVLELSGSAAALAAITDLSVGFGVQGQGRFRADIYRQRGTLGVNIHCMALVPPDLADFQPPAGLAQRVWAEPGLTLVLGRGERLSIIAALVAGYNRTCAGHLIALEHPLEFLHRDALASIAQREVGVDVPSIEAGLRAALVDDSDALSVTDLPTAAAAEMALRLAESGRPMVVGFTGCSPHETLSCLVRLFPVQREREIKRRFSAVLKQVVWVEEGVLQVRAGRVG